MMNISDKNNQILLMLEDIFNVSASLNIKTYIWGGLTIDIWEGKFLRDHGDVDGFVENLVPCLDELKAAYVNKGYKVSFNEPFLILKIEKGSIHAGFNPLQINDKTAEWKHIGNEGSVFFPTDWLDSEPRDFYKTPVYTSGVKFEYAMKTKITMLNPEWNVPREKDLEAIRYLKERIETENILEEDIYKWFWSYNPFWYKRGYDEFFRPTVAWAIQPK